MTKLLVTDLDDTFFKEDDYDKNIKVAKNFINKGNLLVIASGRQSKHLIRDMKLTKLKYSYLISNDGGIIFDNNLNVVYQKNIPSYVIKPIIDLLSDSDIVDGWHIDTGVDVTSDIHTPANGIVARINNIKEANKLLKEIIIKYPDVHGYVDDADNWLNLTEKSVDKGQAVKMVKNLLDINDEDIYTIGNGLNDITMSIYNSYCMKDSDETLKKVCKKHYTAVYELIEDLLK